MEYWGLENKEYTYIKNLITNDFICKVGLMFLDNPLSDARSLTINCIKTIMKIDYRSEITCFIDDSQNTAPKSGNKKYPQANLDKICSK